MQETPSSAPSLYRKWRSRDFADVVGQSHVTQTLRNAVRYNQAGHAYLCTGPRGTGKTSTARILARAVNCLQPCDGEPCNACASCTSILNNRCLDIMEIDAASNNSVDDIRDLREKVNFRPTEVRYKIYIIDEVHMLSTSAFNALLKTLEEPPSHVLFILATTDVHKVPATITSRCQRLDFRAITREDITDRLVFVCSEEGIDAERAALGMIADQATGSLRDALSLLEQVRTFESAHIGIRDVEQALGLARSETLIALSESIIGGDIGGALVLVNQLALAGADMRQYAKQLVRWWRELLLAKTASQVIDRSDQQAVNEQAARVSVADITRVLTTLLQADYSGRRSVPAQWQLELAVAEAAQPFGQAEPQPVRVREEIVVPPAPVVQAADLKIPEKVEAVPIEPVPTITEQPLALGEIDHTGLWRHVQVGIDKKNKPRLTAIVRSDVPVPKEVLGDTFVLGFPVTSTFQRQIVEQAASKAAIEEALSEAAGRTLKLRCDILFESVAAIPDAPTFAEEAARRLRALHMDVKPIQ